MPTQPLFDRLSPELKVLVLAMRFTFASVNGKRKTENGKIAESAEGRVQGASSLSRDFGRASHGASHTSQGSSPHSHDFGRASHGASHTSQGSSPLSRDFSRLSHAAGDALDFQRLIQLAAHHKLRPVLLAYDKEFGILPAEARQQLEALHQRQVIRNLKLTHTYLEVAKLLDSNGIPVLPMKGNLLIHTVYGNQQLRETGDVDILLRQADVIRAVKILQQLGFRLRPDMNPQAHTYQNELVAMMVQSPHQSELPLSNESIHLDVHWNVSQPYFGFQTDTEHVFEQAEIGDFFNTHVLMPSKIDTLMLTLIHHGGKEQWRSLRHLMDVALVMHDLKEHHSSIDYMEEISKRVIHSKVNTMFQTGLRLLNELELISFEDEKPANRTSNQRLVASIVESWHNDQPKSARLHWFKQFPLFLRGRDNRIDVIRPLIQKVTAQIDNNRISAYPDTFGPIHLAKKTTKLLAKLISGEG